MPGTPSSEPGPPDALGARSPGSRPDALGARETRELLERFELRPRTSIGQHFMVDPNTVRRVVADAGVGPGSPVIEVGPGLGTLTRALVGAGCGVLAIERDKSLRPVLAETVGGLDRCEVSLQDAMEVDWPAALAAARRLAGAPADAPVSLVANLPYQISVPLILGLLEDVPQVASQTVMVQAEVGERLVAPAGHDAYGAVSVKVVALASARVTFRVSRRVFLPMPEVESVVVRLDRRVEVERSSLDPLWRVIEAGFAQRRKTLRRALRGAGFDASLVESALERAGIDGSERAERLDLAAFERLAAALFS
ncbi:MAG: 16S rRNA (adenine(1518)-N(6)/adenine(1519)-N(6))-dimethyltransferase RsmA [Actinomycetota bacterium]